MRVGVFLNTDGGVDFYRAKLPIQTATKYKAINSSEIWMSNLVFEAFENTDRFKESLTSDILLLQRISSLNLIGRIKEFLRQSNLKSKIVLDFDDDVFNVSPLSNHYVDYGTEEIKIVHNRSVIHEWKNGVNIDIEKNKKTIDGIKRSLEAADLVTVTTSKLADVFRAYNENVRVLPNCVDLNNWNKLPLLRQNKEEIRICWAGGHSHWEDLHSIRDPLKEIADKYPNVKIIMVGYMPLSFEKDFRKDQVEFHEWVEVPAHPYRLASLDIDMAIIPLKDTVFNRGKSAIKWVEFSALEIPSIASYLSPYKEMAELDPTEENGIFIPDGDPEAWVAGMELLINSKDIRKRMGQKARETVVNHYDINTQYHQWVNVYKEVLSVDSFQSSIK